MLRFNYRYFLVFGVLLSIEIYIAVSITTGFVRHTIGDFLVVIMIYTFIRSFLAVSVLRAASITFIFSMVVEVLQLLNLPRVLHLKSGSPLTIILGTTFSLQDVFAYMLGIIFILLVEHKILKNE